MIWYNLLTQTQLIEVLGIKPKHPGPTPGICVFKNKKLISQEV